MRLPPIAPADLSPLQRPLYDGMRSGVGAKYDLFTTTRTDGALLGPWNAWLNQPEVGAAFWTVTQAMTAFKVLPDAVRQVAILAVGARFGAAYEIDAHGAVAQARHAMSDQRLSTLAAGERPPDLTNEEATDRRAVALFGQAGANELIDLVGHTCFVAVTLNGFAIPVPEDEAAGSGERA